MSVAEVHVIPSKHDATWAVGFDPASPAISSHTTADQAQMEAKRIAVARGARRVFLHDRYQRVRTITLRPPPASG